MVEPCLHRLDCIRGQLQSFGQELQRMHGLEFPYGHSRLAIQKVQSTFDRIKRYADYLAPQSDQETVEALCQTVSGYLEDALRILGFILRSTNVRNAFEVHGPMLRLTRLVLGGDAKLLLSSEWEMSPFLLLGAKVLPSEYVLIGQPASESANPFLLPLAGHELGHSVWSRYKLQAHFDKAAKSAIANRLKRQWNQVKQFFPSLSCRPEELENDLGGSFILSQAVEWCCRQLEETFCDCFGVRMFGTAYFYSFAYLLSPQVAPLRTPFYPDYKDRATDQINIAKKFGFGVPDSYGDLFHPSPSDGSSQEDFLLSVVDAVRKSLVDQVMTNVEEISQSAGLPMPSANSIQTCFNTLRHFVPCLEAVCLADITNAAWQARLTNGFFASEDLEKDKIVHLSELILKSIEVFEIEQCLKDKRDSSIVKPLS